MTNFPIFQYEIHSDIVGFGDFITRLDAFITTVGGTVAMREFQIDKAWTNLGGGTYGWATSADSHYMELDNGGGQWRGIIENSGELVKMNMSGNTAGSNYSTATSVSPNHQTADRMPGFRDWPTLNRTITTVLPRYDYYRVWFFGNSEGIAWVIQFDPSCVLQNYFGRPVIIDTTNPNKYCWLGTGSTLTNASSAPTLISSVQTTTNFYCPWFSEGNHVVYENNAQIPYPTINTTMSNPNTSPSSVIPPSYLAFNQFTNNKSPNRLIWQADLPIIDHNDSQYFHAGNHPIGFFLPVIGDYFIGQEITIGTQTFKVFPRKSANNATYGAGTWNAYRIA
jgi:hypothetical protein